MRRTWRILGSVAGLGVLAGAAFATYAWEGAIEAVEPPDPASFDAVSVERGARLAAIGNCNVCHVGADGAPYAGGAAIETPFGAIHATNITPDRETGIGDWPIEAFDRAMREGVDREGRHLYPAFPYDHFTRMREEDNRDLYAFLMTREAVRAEEPENDLPFPLDRRVVLAGWKLLFFEEGIALSDPARDYEWNRGRYLAEGLGHCGACHTPRNLFGAEIESRHFEGAEIDGWHAYAIDETSPAPVPWTVDSLAFYLRHGFHETHGVSRGSMAPVTANLGSVDEADSRAIATYVVSVMGEPTAARRARSQEVLRLAAAGPRAAAQAGDSLALPEPAGATALGAAIWAAACSTCHDAGRAVPAGGLNLHLSTAINAPSPQNVINVTLQGLPAPAGEPGAIMPGYAGTMTEDQLVALLDYMRETFSDEPGWEDARERVADTMAGETRPTPYRSDGVSAAPAAAQVETAPWR